MINAVRTLWSDSSCSASRVTAFARGVGSRLIFPQGNSSHLLDAKSLSQKEEAEEIKKMTTVAQYTNVDLISSVLQKPFITATEGEVAKVWRDLCAQVVYNYNDNCSTDIPPFAIFSFSSSGRPTARLTKSFLRNSNARCETDEYMMPSAIRQVCYTDLATASRHDAKTLLQFVFQELGDALRVRAQRINLQLPGLCTFTFDRRTRCYKFVMNPSLPRREPVYRSKWPEPKDSSETMDPTMATTRPCDAQDRAQKDLAASRTMTPRANSMLQSRRPGTYGPVDHDQTIRPVKKQQRPFDLNAPFRVKPLSQSASRPLSQTQRPASEPAENYLPSLTRTQPALSVQTLTPQTMETGTIPGSLGQTQTQGLGLTRTLTPMETTYRKDMDATETHVPLVETLAGTGLQESMSTGSKPDFSTTQPMPTLNSGASLQSTVKAPGTFQMTGRPATQPMTKPKTLTTEDLFRTRAEEFTRDFCQSFKPPMRSHIEYGPIYERMLHEELDKARDAYIQARVRGEDPSRLAKTTPFKGLICPNCASLKELEAKRKAKAEHDAREKREFTEHARRQAEEARREEEARRRAAYERDRAHMEYNKDVAANLYRKFREWRQAGHHFSEGTINPMPVLFDNDPDLDRRRREEAKRLMEDFIRDFLAKKKAKDSEKQRSRLEDKEYAASLKEEEMLRRVYEQASEEAKKRLQKELLDRQLAEYHDPRVAEARIPDYYEMGSALPPEDIEAILARRRREAEDVRDTAKRNALARRMQDKLLKAKEEADDMAAYLRDQEDLANERRCRAEHERAVREQMLKDVEEQIALKNQRRLQEKLDAMRPPSCECFRSEEDEPTCCCDCCGRRVHASQMIAIK